MGGLISKVASWSNFTFYYNVKPHLCKGRKKRREIYYKYLSGMCTDRSAVNEPKLHKKKTISVPTCCSCPQTIQLRVSGTQLAISNLFEPYQIYEYESKEEVSTTQGFNYWLYEITRKLHTVSEFNNFIGGLIPGVTFYDGEYLGRQFDKIKSEIDFENEFVASEPEFVNFLKKLIHQSISVYNQENFFVTNTILEP